MPPFLWIPATIFASGFQVARNGLQRSILPMAGPWGATLVRFLFGLPFSLAFVALAAAATPGARAHFSPAFWFGATTGALAGAGDRRSARRHAAGGLCGRHGAAAELAAAGGHPWTDYFSRSLERRSLDRRRDHHRGARRADLAEGRGGRAAGLRRSVRAGLRPLLRLLAECGSPRHDRHGRGPPAVRGGRLRRRR